MTSKSPRNIKAYRHCERYFRHRERSVAIHAFGSHGLPRFARNDGKRSNRKDGVVSR